MIRRGAELWTVDTGANALKHLARIDASFLCFETPETPMHMGSLMLLDLPAGFAAAYGKAHPSGIEAPEPAAAAAAAKRKQPARRRS